MILNVGCGNRPLGDINCDLYIHDIGHRGGKNNISAIKNIKNFIVCDGQYLPFKDSCFELVCSSHVIEHVINPFLFLSESVRVSKNRIKIICPHRFGDKFYQVILRRKNKFHLHYFNLKWFEYYGDKLKCYVMAKYSKFVNIPFVNFLPIEIEIELIKVS